MKTIKFLCIAILGMYCCEIYGMLAGPGPFVALPIPPAAAPVLDFDTIFAPAIVVPESLQPKLYDNPQVDAPNRRCVYFTVINNAAGAPAPVAFNAAAAAVPNPANEHNIYFPADGSQPTTPEAVEYSCANIDNREDSPITDWYMQMFGVIPINQAVINAAVIGGNPVPPAPDYVQAGWSAPAGAGAINVERIISFAANFNENDLEQDPDSGEILSRREFFVRKFRRIASTSVGRVLLYRLLIEIRRHQAGNNGGLLEPVIPPNLWLIHRNSSRSLEIRWGKFEYGYTNISVLNFAIPIPAIGRSHNGYNRIVKFTPSLDVMLFHEMNHWYHHLRNPNRYMEELNYSGIGRRLNGTLTPAVAGALGTTNINAAALGIHYWQGLLGVGDPRLSVSEEVWKNPLQIGAITVYRVPFEEMRNILGVPSNGIVNRLQGDELSENLYRMCIGAPLRYGYWQSITQSSTCYEDSRVIDRVIDSCTSYKEHYNCIPISLGNVDYEWGNVSNRIGIGNFRIF